MARRKRDDPREWEFRGHWLGRVAGTTSIYECWWDAGTKRRQRRSLGTSDEEEAKERLVANVLKDERTKDADPDDVYLAVTLATYLTEHGNKIASAYQQGRAAEILVGFFKNDKVGAVKKARQAAFVDHCRHELKHADRTISRTLSVLRAALKHCHRAEYLASHPHIFDVGSFPVDGQSGEIDTPEYALSIDQIAAFFDAIKSDHVFMYAMIGLNTGARPGAILACTKFQRDRDAQLLRLLPTGQRQTQKRRAAVPVTGTLAAWLDAAERSGKSEHYVHYRGKALTTIKKAHRDTADAAGLGQDVTPKCWRHTVAKELRRRGVPEWEVQGFLGHRKAGTKTTERYAVYAPEYLSKARAALDDLMREVDAKVTKWSLSAPKGVKRVYQTKAETDKELARNAQIA